MLNEYLYSCQNAAFRGSMYTYKRNKQTMIKSPKLLNAKNSIRPYTDVYNVESVYHNDATISANCDELTDEQIDSLINDQDARHSADCFNNEIHSDLMGDDYADAVLAELGL